MTLGDAEDPFSFGKVSGANFNSPAGIMRKNKSYPLQNDQFKFPSKR